MREILFRGKRIDNGEWVYGYLFKIWERAYILWGTTNGIPNMIEVDSVTVGQFTGITDKNGKGIFDGDVLITHGIDGTLVWQAKFYEDNLWGFEGVGNPYSSVHNSVDTDGVVIGNIYDNPELSEGKS